jgi:formylglycine-generating enzyme required for sulfatase activity
VPPIREANVLFELLTLPLVALPHPVPAAQARGQVQPPPGMVLIAGGRTKIGSTVKEIEALALRDPTVFRITSVETPQHEVKVDDFFLMVNEVTNEQYLAFVRAARHRAPEHWAAKVIDEAQARYLEEQGQKAQEAKAAGKRYEIAKFERSSWWRQHGDEHLEEGTHWSMPESEATLPVVYVDYESAEAYARWAGLRLMTEFEFQRAGRGDDARPYPWGDAFDRANAVTTDSKVDKPRPAGSLPGGATSQGVFELSGNVWEWTSSPFMPYPRYEVMELEFGKGKDAKKDIATVSWDENSRVAVGGSWQNGTVAARLTTRRNSERSQSTDSLGFRCAATPVPGLDIATTVLRQDVPPEVRPEGVVFDVAKVTAMDRWQAGKGNVAVPGYGVIESYDYALFVPVVELDISSAKQLDDVSHESGPVTFGVLSLTRDAIEPPLPKGTYFVSYLAPGKETTEPAAPASGMALPQDGAPAQAPAQEGEPAPVVVALPEGIDRTRANLVFYSPDDQPVAAMPVTGLEFSRPKPPTILVGEGVRVEMQPNKRGELAPVDVPCDQVILGANTWVRVSNKGFSFNLVLKFAKGSLGDGWRR